MIEQGRVAIVRAEIASFGRTGYRFDLTCFAME
jgi:hypothetical protein